MHRETIKSLKARSVDLRSLSLLLDCAEDHVAGLLSGSVSPSSRERAILRLCANVVDTRLKNILSEFEEENGWRIIPGFSAYEISRSAQVRRRKSGHGSLPGLVLKPRFRGKHLVVNLASDDRGIRSVFVHQLMCATFHGPQPSPRHMVCHKNDVGDDNRPENLYWGTAADNRRDMERNGLVAFIDTQETQRAIREGGKPLQELRKRKKKSMLYRLDRMAKMGT